VSRTPPAKLRAPKASPQQCAPTWPDLSPIPESALQTSCASPGRPSGRSRAGFPECSIPRPATFREAACARPAAPGSPAIQSTWRAPAGTIPSAAAGQAHTHPCGPSSPSSPTMPPSHAASPAERFEILLASARHAAIVITALPQAQSDSPERQVLSRNKQELPARSRPSPPSRSCPAHPQRKRSRVPKRRRFRHSAPRLSSISDAWGRLNVVTPFHHLSGDSHLHRSLAEGPITASSLGRELINLPGKTGRRESALPGDKSLRCSEMSQRANKRRREFVIATPLVILSPSGVVDRNPPSDCRFSTDAVAACPWRGAFEGRLAYGTESALREASCRSRSHWCRGKFRARRNLDPDQVRSGLGRLSNQHAA